MYRTELTTHGMTVSEMISEGTYRLVVAVERLLRARR